MAQHDPKAMTTPNRLWGTEECVSLPGGACFALSGPRQSQLAGLQLLRQATEGGGHSKSVCELGDVLPPHSHTFR